VVHANDAEIEAAVEGESLARFVESHRIREMIVTHGEAGARVLANGRDVEVSARPTRGRHLVGAGDVFLATYLLLRTEGREPEDAARGAAEACAARIDQGRIPPGFYPGNARG
jgi:sugar/nucleoside kinase (ribokinase family)